MGAAHALPAKGSTLGWIDYESIQRPQRARQSLWETNTDSTKSHKESSLNI
jgi:hypothetical protein